MSWRENPSSSSQSISIPARGELNGALGRQRDSKAGVQLRGLWGCPPYQGTGGTWVGALSCSAEWDCSPLGTNLSCSPSGDALWSCSIPGGALCPAGMNFFTRGKDGNGCKEWRWSCCRGAEGKLGLSYKPSPEKGFWGKRFEELRTNSPKF